jgi:hypothetical protein
MTFLSWLWRLFSEEIGICPACLAPWDGKGACGRCGGPYMAE